MKQNIRSSVKIQHILRVIVCLLVTGIVPFAFASPDASSRFVVIKERSRGIPSLRNFLFIPAMLFAQSAPPEISLRIVGDALPLLV